MINQTEHLLICAAEECAEVQQRITKALRFGLDEIQPGQEFTNAHRIMTELADLLGVLEMLSDVLPQLRDMSPDDVIKTKQAKVRRFMDYARAVGTLEGRVAEPEVANA